MFKKTTQVGVKAVGKRGQIVCASSPVFVSFSPMKILSLDKTDGEKSIIRQIWIDDKQLITEPFLATAYNNSISDMSIGRFEEHQTVTVEIELGGDGYCNVLFVGPRPRTWKLEDAESAWQQTFTSKAFTALAPKTIDIDIIDIAHALSLQCRFGGHCRVHYSVSEHCVRASEIIRDIYGASKYTQLAMLLHDAAESYVVDVPRPIKPYLTNYAEIEYTVMQAVAKKFNIHVDEFSSRLVKEVDMIMLATEKRDLMGPEPRPWDLDAKPHPTVIVPWSPAEAEQAFLTKFKELSS